MQPVTKISYVIAVRNGAGTVRRAIDSIVSQAHHQVECIVIDGGSTDGTQEIIKEYKEQLAYFVSEKDNGIYDAWNKGLARASGQYIAFVGADDEVLPGAISQCLDFLRKNPGIEYVSFKVLFGGSGGRVIGQPWSWHSFRKRMTVAHVGSIHRRDLYDRYGTYDVSYKISGDYEFLLRVGDKLKSGFINEIMIEMADGGVSNKHILTAVLENILAQYKNKSCSVLQSLIWALLAIVASVRASIARYFQISGEQNK